MIVRGMMTVVFTGAAGHVGANLVEALLGQSVPVRAAACMVDYMQVRGTWPRL